MAELKRKATVLLGRKEDRWFTDEVVAKKGALGVSVLLSAGARVRNSARSLVTSRSSEGESSSSSSSSGSESDEPLRANLRVYRRGRSSGSLGGSSVESRKLRERARELLCIPDEPTTLWGEIERRLGIEELRLLIATRQLEVKEKHPRSPVIYNLVKDLRFEAGVGVMILLNAITLGWNSFYRPGDERPRLLEVAETMFTIIFLLEWMLRIVAFTWVWIVSSAMNMFDTILIWGTGVLVAWILPLAGVDADVLNNLGCLRILRLARLCRCIRLVPFFRELWILVQGVIECSRLLFWTWIIVGSIHFIFGVAVVDLVAKSDTFESDEDVQYYFGSLATAMISLFQIMTFDSWGGIIRPIVHKAPETFVLFGLYAGIAGIVLFNLMTAIVVQNAFERVKKDVEAVDYWNREKEKRVRDDLRRCFDDMDEDGSGFLTEEEFTDVLDDVEFVRKMKMLDIDLEELPDVFEILDDGDKMVDQEEFIKGLMWMQGCALNRDILKAIKCMSMQTNQFKELEMEMKESVDDSMINISSYCLSVREDTESLNRMSANIIESLNTLGMHRLYTASSLWLPEVPPPLFDESQHVKEQLRRAAVASAELDDPSSPRKGGMDAEEPATSPKTKGITEALMPVPLRMIEDLSARTGRGWRRKKSLHASAFGGYVYDNSQDNAIVSVLTDFQEQWPKLGLKLRSSKARRPQTSKGSKRLTMARLKSNAHVDADEPAPPLPLETCPPEPNDNMLPDLAPPPPQHTAGPEGSPASVPPEMPVDPTGRFVADESRAAVCLPNAIAAETMV